MLFKFNIVNFFLCFIYLIIKLFKFLIFLLRYFLGLNIKLYLLLFKWENIFFLYKYMVWFLFLYGVLELIV